MPKAVRVLCPEASTLQSSFAKATADRLCRGNNGQEVFVNENGIRLYLHTLEELCIQTRLRIHDYVLSPPKRYAKRLGRVFNHYHLLLETPEANLVAGMNWFQVAYTQRFNAMMRNKVLKTWGLMEGESGCEVACREKLERFMRFEEDLLAGMRGDFDR